tara:strand:+ start:35 stop:439 length:405 start_codon:yes stop_codon:yes gene_type:complete
MPNYSPKNAMMESGKQPPMGLGDLMGSGFQDRDKSGYQPMVDADVSQLMSSDFQNRDRSGGYDQMLAAQQKVPGSEGRQMYPQFTDNPEGNQIKQLREMLQGRPEEMNAPVQQQASGQGQSVGAMDVYRAMLGG